MDRASGRGLAFGDVLRRPIPGGLARHYGVYLGVVDGIELVFHGVDDPRERGRGVYETVSMAEFGQGQPVEQVVVEKGEPQAIKARVSRLLAEGGFRYHVLGGDEGRNCEEIARYVACGRWDSMQAKAERKTRGAQWGMVAGAAIFAASALVAVTQYLLGRDRRA
jgi:hypothetical protein